MTSDPKNPLAPFGLNEDGTRVPDPYDVIDDGITDDPFGNRPRKDPRAKPARREVDPAAGKVDGDDRTEPPPADERRSGK